MSIGFVPVDGLSIVLAGARQMLVRGAAVGQSATIHGLTDDTVASGLDLADALAAVLDALRGRVLLAHHAAIERDFLGAACQKVYGQPLPCVTVDTLELEHRLLNPGWGQEPPQGSLRLGAARERHGLPRYRSHEALTDALACAERIRTRIAALCLPTDKGPLRFTVSIGLAALDSRRPGWAELLRAADAALYRAKAGGRNRTVLAHDG